MNTKPKFAWSDAMVARLRELRTVHRMTTREIEKTMRVGREHVMHKIAELGLPSLTAWSPEHVAILVDGWASGRRAEDIGNDVGRKLSAVTTMRRHMGLPNRSQCQRTPKPGTLSRSQRRAAARLVREADRAVRADEIAAEKAARAKASLAKKREFDRSRVAALRAQKAASDKARRVAAAREKQALADRAASAVTPVGRPPITAPYHVIAQWAEAYGRRNVATQGFDLAKLNASLIEAGERPFVIAKAVHRGSLPAGTTAAHRARPASSIGA